jgi:hypothetical protein
MCPQCGLTGSSGKHNKNTIWSPSQRFFGKVHVETVNVHHNCCKKCSTSYYVAPDHPPPTRPPLPPTTTTNNQPQPPPTTSHHHQPPIMYPITRYAEVVTDSCFNEALRRIRLALPVGFWVRFHGNTGWYGQEERNRSLIKRLKQMWPDYNTGAGAMKFMSYFGAVKAHSGIPGSLIQAWDSTRQAYFDPGNEVYSYILDKVWPGCLPGMTNRGTLGDVLEAFLGFGWFMGHPDNMQPHMCHYQLQVYDDLHKVIAWLYDHWEDRMMIIWAA